MKSPQEIQIENLMFICERLTAAVRQLQQEISYLKPNIWADMVWDAEKTDLYEIENFWLPKVKKPPQD